MTVVGIMKTFSGFVSGKNKTVSLTDQFFTDLLPLIDDLVELKVTLACLRLFDQKAGLLKWANASDLENDPALKDVRASISVGLVRAVERGSILQAADRSHEVYLLLNDNYGRAAKQSIERGESIEQIPAIADRPNIYTLYEQNIGTLTPMIAEELKAAEQEFPPQLIAEAFQQAVKQNVRSWAYIQKILDNRSRKGKSDETRERDVAADWQRILQKDKRK
jgi:DNA replication protein